MRSPAGGRPEPGRRRPGYRRARRVHRSRSDAARRADEAQTAERVTTDADEYAERPGEVDYAGVDTGPDYGRDRGEDEGRAMVRQASMVPVHGDPTLDPVTRPEEVARMAGYGDAAGYDTLQGIDKMVMGEVDAKRELRAESSTEGPPLRLASNETCFTDTEGRGVMDTGLDPEEDPAQQDWMSEFRGGDLGAAAGWADPGDWTGCL